MPSVLLLLFTIGMSSAHSCKPHQMVCPFGWESWGGSCYKLLKGRLNWHEGRLKCRELGGEMVAPSSPEENNYIVNTTTDRLWINCNDLDIEGQWDCTPADNGGYMNWNLPYEPNGGTWENCAELVPSWSGKWNDDPCSEIVHVICKGEEVK